MAQDVAAFLVWTAEPNLENRARTGLAVADLPAVATILAYLAYQNIWHGREAAVRATGPLDPENMAKRDAASQDAGISA